MKNESYCQPGESRQRGRTVNDCSHIYSDGTGVHGLFENEQEIYGGVNLVAVTAFYCEVKVLMVQVMTTHIHLIVSGSAAARARFAKDLKIKLGKILAKKCGVRVQQLSVSNDPICEERELMNKIMYVYRNAIAAGYKLMPWLYPGGPGDIFFVDHEREAAIGRPLSDYSRTQRIVMFHTRLDLPDDWRVNGKGLLLPHCWIDWRRVESLYRNPRTFLAFLGQSRDMDCSMNQETARQRIESVGESELRVIGRQMCQEMFGRTAMARASVEERIAVARRIWSERLTYSLSSLSRVTQLDKPLLESILCSRM